MSDKLIKKGADYFKLPLDPRSNDDLAAEFQGKLADAIAKSFNKTEKVEPEVKKEEKEKQVLNEKLRKIEKKWDEYVENANKLGVDPKVFCNQTCSHECFLDADKSTYEILTTCLINKCECFKPKLPKASNEVSLDALMALKKIIEEEEDKPKYENVTENKPTAGTPIVTGDATAAIKDKVGSVTIANAQEVGKEIDDFYNNAKHKAEDIWDKSKDAAKDAEDRIGKIAEKGKDKVDEIVDEVKKKTRKEAPGVQVLASTEPTAQEGATPTEAKECDLKCFKDCLELKKFVPYPVIQQCIEVRCHCVLDNTSEKLQYLVQSNALDVLSSPEIQTQRPSLFANFLLALFMLSIMMGAAFVLFKFIAEREGKRKYHSSDSYSEPMYERLA